MNIKRMAGVGTVALAVGFATLTAGGGVAAAQPGGPCGPGSCQGPGHPGGPGGFGGPGGPDGRFGRGGPPPGAGFRRFDAPPPPPPALAWRGIDQGRFDHQPFNYNGSWVTPIFNPEFNNWGFWLFGLWIPL